MNILIDRRDPRTQPQGVEPGYPQTAMRWPSQPLHKRPLTASELSGPQDLLQRLAPVRGDLAGHGAKRAIGQLIHVRARVVDEDGAPVPGAVVEIWHCNAAGKYIHPWWRPPHVHFSVWGRTWLSRLVTQMFFPGEPLNDSDAVLNAIRDPEARERCIARLVPPEKPPAKAPEQALAYEYQLVVRGRKATPGLP